jgi:hypothetical protein
LIEQTFPHPLCRKMRDSPAVRLRPAMDSSQAPCRPLAPEAVAEPAGPEEEVAEPRLRFPGEELVDPGLADLAAGRATIEALLVAAARPRLERVGVQVPEHRLDSSGRELYALLEEQLGTRAHARYNALTRRLISYCSARAQDARRRR